jgi:Na+/H+-dicarboxylate symporter
MSEAFEQLPSRSLINLGRHLRTIIRQRLWLQVLIGMALGIGFGILTGPSLGLVSPAVAEPMAGWIALPGRLFLASIQFVVVPLVVASVIRGIAAGEASENIGRMGLMAVLFFVVTTIVAVVIGLLAAGMIEPGQYLDRATLVGSTSDTSSRPGATPPAASLPNLGELPDLLIGLLPKDPLAAFISGNMLQIVIAAIIIGVALLMTPATQRLPLLDLLASVQAVCMVIVGYVLRFAPIAVFGLLANISAQIGISAMLGLAAYVATVLLALIILLLLYVVVVVVVTRSSPLLFLSQMREVMLLAFSTSSSAAVMPLTLSTTEEKFRVPASIARFVIPLGTTINMGGTALYQGAATLFLAQVFGIDIGVSGLVLVVVLATGAAIGSPGTPGVGIVILTTILAGVGVPPEGIAIILGVDRILDMARTVVNVTGDVVAAITVNRLLGGSSGDVGSEADSASASAGGEAEDKSDTDE